MTAHTSHTPTCPDCDGHGRVTVRLCPLHASASDMYEWMKDFLMDDQLYSTLAQTYGGPRAALLVNIGRRILKTADGESNA